MKLKINMRDLIILFAIIIACSIGAMYLNNMSPNKSYKIKISFCDSRKPIITSINSYREPNNMEILNYKMAVPTYNQYMNVCNIEVIK